MSHQSVLLTQLVVAGAEIALAVVVARLLLAVALALAARCVGSRRTGARLRAMALRASPRFARGLIAATVGATLVIAPSAAGAAPERPRPAAHAAAPLPVLDRVIGQVATGGTLSWRDDAPPPVPRTSSRPPRAGERDDRARTVAPTRTARTHVVRAGDSLWSIAAAHLPVDASAARIARSWPRWYQVNRDVIGADPARIVPGTVLRAPASR